jgi:hypothetical protein
MLLVDYGHLGDKFQQIVAVLELQTKKSKVTAQLPVGYITLRAFIIVPIDCRHLQPGRTL